jgi:hypothetical protein
MFKKSDQINEIAAALAKAQGEMDAAKKSTNNAFFNSKYADLNSVQEACGEALHKNHLAVIQGGGSHEGKNYLVTLLLHSSGQWIESWLEILLPSYAELEDERKLTGKKTTKNIYHILGSAITYLRRYSLGAMVGVSTEEDDDANSASWKQSKKEKDRPVEVVPSEPIRSERELMDDLLFSYKPDMHGQIQDFLAAYAAHWKKTTYEALIDHQDLNKFSKVFARWREKHNKAA